ncbi:RFC3-like protein [Mya arenaria]|uniref:RFC3-like protein n=1 Tax=Mya arenaria TaxID=6604 RepID=A0ABY7DQ25_MYAAR|nr:RFC3-like protein [Mya arenaria]
MNTRKCVTSSVNMSSIKGEVAGGDFPHLLVYGPSGAGKKTRIMCILKELYGSGVEKLRIEQHHFTTPSKKKLEISTISSNYHIEVNPSDVGNNDRVVIQELIKTVAQVDRLTKDAQHALRRTMEKYMATCRLILCCNSTSKKEGLNLPMELAKRIAEKSNRNLRRALLMCEACRVQHYPFTADQAVSEPDWEVYLRDTAHMIVQQQMRGRLYELLTHCIPADIIMKTEVIQTAAYYEHRLQLGQKAIYHLEAFVAKFMAIYKRFLEEGIADIF